VSDQKHAVLIERLIRKTAEGQTEWKKSVLEDRFQISFRDNTVRIKAPPEGDYDNPVFILELMNGEGTVVESVSDEELDRDIPMGKHHWFKQLSSLFEMARRSALGADKVLNEILADLDDDLPF
jgi:hypothetical protein